MALQHGARILTSGIARRFRRVKLLLPTLAHHEPRDQRFIDRTGYERAWSNTTPPIAAVSS